MKYLILALLTIPSIFLSQEKITISGYIEEELTGEKLIGGTVYDLNSQKGTITNDYGFYSLTLAKDSVKLRISFSGFETQIISEFYQNDISLNFKLKDVSFKRS